MSEGERWLKRETLDGQIPIARAIAALHAVDSDDVWLFGADDFTAPSHPSLDFILDPSGLSASDGARESVRQGLAVLERWPADLLVELVVR